MRLLGALVVGLVLAVLGAACRPPQLPAITGCAAGATRCAADGTPEVCSGSARWTRLYDTAGCSAPLACCRNAVVGGEPVYSCAPPGACVQEPDAGAPDAADASDESEAGHE